MTLVTHDFRLQETVIVILPDGVAVRGTVRALLQHDRLKVAVTDELTLSVPAEDCRRPEQIR